MHILVCLAHLILLGNLQGSITGEFFCQDQKTEAEEICGHTAWRELKTKLATTWHLIVGNA